MEATRYRLPSMSSTPPERNGWSGYERFVVKKLEEHDANFKRIDEQIVGLRVDVAGLKVRAGVWGATAGAIPACLTAILVFVGGGPG